MRETQCGRLVSALVGLGRKLEARRKEGSKEGRKEGRKEGNEKDRSKVEKKKG